MVFIQDREVCQYEIKAVKLNCIKRYRQRKVRQLDRDIKSDS